MYRYVLLLLYVVFNLLSVLNYYGTEQCLSAHASGRTKDYIWPENFKALNLITAHIDGVAIMPICILFM